MAAKKKSAKKKSSKSKGGKKALRGAALKAHLAAKKRGGPKPRSKKIPLPLLKRRLTKLSAIVKSRS